MFPISGVDMRNPPLSEISRDYPIPDPYIERTPASVPANATDPNRPGNRPPVDSASGHMIPDLGPADSQWARHAAIQTLPLIKRKRIFDF